MVFCGLPFTRSRKSAQPRSYTYSTLEKESREIRILTLLPGPAESKTRVRVRIARLIPRSGDIPHFEAVSYAWGSPETTSVVYIYDDEGRESTIKITHNLAVALQHLRHATEERDLWIDAICIDQQNLEERSQQVQRMADIFRSANRVIVWLGPESQWSSHALYTMEYLSQQIDVDWNTYQIKPASQGSPDPGWANSTAELRYSVDTVLAIANLVLRPWFGRLWIWQEILLANSDAVVMCGSQTMRWHDFRDAILCMSYKWFSADPFTEDEFRLRMQLIVNLCRTQEEVTLPQIILRTSNAICTDPRDRIYSLLSLLPASEQRLIQPDYTKPFEAVYQDVVFFFGKYGTLDLLASCSLPVASDTRPSWVPDWSGRVRDENPINNNNASGSSRAVVELIDERTLRITGIPCGRVTRVINALELSGPRNKSYVGITADLRRLVNLAVSATREDSAGTLLETLSQTICCDRVAELFSPPITECPSLDEIRKLISQAKDPNWDGKLPDPIPYSTSLVLETFCGMAEGKALIITSQGHIGLSSELVEVGDLVTVFLGCDFPIVLRPKASQFQVVSQCYIADLVSGEALFGPLPTQCRYVQSLSKSGYYAGSYIRAVLDTTTGTIQSNDPRLWPLSDGWRKKYPEDDNPPIWFVNDITGEDAGYEDPRVRPESLTAHGVELRTFDLV